MGIFEYHCLVWTISQSRRPWKDTLKPCESHLISVPLQLHGLLLRCAGGSFLIYLHTNSTLFFVQRVKGELRLYSEIVPFPFLPYLGCCDFLNLTPQLAWNWTLMKENSSFISIQNFQKINKYQTKYCHCFTKDYVVLFPYTNKGHALLTHWM